MTEFLCLKNNKKIEKTKIYNNYLMNCIVNGIEAVPIENFNFYL